MDLYQRIPVINISDGFCEKELLCRAAGYRDALCAGLLIAERSASDAEHERAIHFIKKLKDETGLPLFVCKNVYRFEDVKKYIYAGALVVYCDPALSAEEKAFNEGVKRFGKERVKLSNPLLETEQAEGEELVKTGILPVNPVTPSFSWEDVGADEKGLVPVIVQDWRTDEVLMLAYMNEEAYNETLRTGRMVYYSRSRGEQWVKGLTSGHFQYVKSMYLDCDKDTILAKVHQIGAACHTGAYSCFFNEIFSKEEDAASGDILESVMSTILDRKANPKEGSYTCYLFEKGIDKILKKCGEEAAEIIIAAKNPDKEEIKYEIADFLYHVMVLMAERGITWDEVMGELENR